MTASCRNTSRGLTMTQTKKMYLAQNEAGEEFGPADQDTLIRWAEEGKINAFCKVRTTLIPKWDKAVDIPFLKPLLIAQVEEQLRKKHDSFFARLKKRVTLCAEDVVQTNALVKVKLETFNNASLPHRFMAGLIDTGVIIIGAILIYLFFALLFYLGIVGPENVFYLGFIVFWVWLLMYFTLSISLAVQTIGQRFWGIFLVRLDGRPFGMGRAFCYTLFLIPFGWLTVPVGMFKRTYRGIPEKISYTRMAKMKLLSKKPR
jgi:uncharacterized RDD family membrane protein YckC